MEDIKKETKKPEKNHGKPSNKVNPSVLIS